MYLHRSLSYLGGSESVGKDRPLDMFARGIGVPGLADKIRQQPGSERYYDPSEHADELNNFIC